MKNWPNRLSLDGEVDIKEAEYEESSTDSEKVANLPKSRQSAVGGNKAITDYFKPQSGMDDGRCDLVKLKANFEVF